MNSRSNPEVFKSQKCSEMRNYSSDYGIDFWLEIRRRWLVLGVLLSIMMAMIVPRAGATGGILHADYLVYIPLCYIYYRAGKRARKPPNKGSKEPHLDKGSKGPQHTLENSFNNRNNYSINYVNNSIANENNQNNKQNCKYDNYITTQNHIQKILENINLNNQTEFKNDTLNNQDENRPKNSNRGKGFSEKGLKLPMGYKGPVGSKGSEGYKVPFWKLVLSVMLYTHVVCPALCALTVEAFKGVGMDYRVIKGLMISCSGGSAPWLPLSLSARDRRSVLAVLMSWVSTPLWMPLVDMVICGHIIIPPLSGIFMSLLTILIPFTIGIVTMDYFPSFIKQRADKYKEHIKRNNIDDVSITNGNCLRINSELYYAKVNECINLNEKSENKQINELIHERTYLLPTHKQSLNNNKESIKQSDNKYKVDLKEFDRYKTEVSNINKMEVIVMGNDIIDTKVHVAMLLVLYVEVCDRVHEAEETLYVGDVLLCLVLGSLSVRCGPVSSLPAAISLPALALLIAVKETSQYRTEDTSEEM